MSRGKYSPAWKPSSDFIYNARREIAPEYIPGTDYSEEIHFGDYDKDGYDRYGYSAWYADGTYAGFGAGIDRLGYTEYDYMCMTAEEYDNVI